MLSRTCKSRHVVGFVCRPLKPPFAQAGVARRQHSTVSQVFGDIDIGSFRRDSFEVEKPLFLKPTGKNVPSAIPALEKWFTTTSIDGHNETSVTPYLEQHSTTWLPYELMMDQTSEPPLASPLTSFLTWLSASGASDHQALAALLLDQTETIPHSSTPQACFLRFEAPLGLLLAGLKFNQQSPPPHRLQQLYIAQAPLDTLPPQLQDDVPTPTLVKEAGKGDVYNSSIWMGLEPTYTPWHRDPNPNFFCQLHSSKVVRLMPPRRGEQLFLQARSQLGQAGGSRIRGDEMMQGEERRVLLDAVWGEGAPDDMREVRLDRADALFIPKGWWHSLRSDGSQGGLNASVNWWFR
ncbi:hypothetical protein B0T18DRAFT_402051 [Schizothecium vesticola]|uniref:JmjC domain-containing protein n=1 Tax=Schizothecium vesticola TaxID=314040 RepID=A0AA40KA04_9PEZI|nr:hypothetical protein B0T18DRAFT_402051 [Schizothecium vesticola]